MQTNEADFETHVDDIVKAIGDKLERNVIVTELKRYVEEYGIDLATAPNGRHIRQQKPCTSGDPRHAVHMNPEFAKPASGDPALPPHVSSHQFPCIGYANADVTERPSYLMTLVFRMFRLVTCPNVGK